MGPRGRSHLFLFSRICLEVFFPSALYCHQTLYNFLHLNASDGPEWSSLTCFISHLCCGHASSPCKQRWPYMFCRGPWQKLLDKNVRSTFQGVKSVSASAFLFSSYWNEDEWEKEGHRAGRKQDRALDPSSPHSTPSLGSSEGVPAVEEDYLDKVRDTPIAKSFCPAKMHD